MKIRDIRNNEEDKKERDAENDAHAITGYDLLIYDAELLPGAWIKNMDIDIKISEI